MTDLNVAPVATMYREAAAKLRARTEAVRNSGSALHPYVLGNYHHAPEDFGSLLVFLNPVVLLAMVGALEEGANNGGTPSLTDLANEILRMP